jgi:hypothetical protein
MHANNLKWKAMIRKIYGAKLRMKSRQRVAKCYRGLKVKNLQYIRHVMAVQYDLIMGSHKAQLKSLIHKRDNTMYGFFIHSEIKLQFGKHEVTEEIKERKPRKSILQTEWQVTDSNIGFSIKDMMKGGKLKVKPLPKVEIKFDRNPYFAVYYCLQRAQYRAHARDFGNALLKLS